MTSEQLQKPSCKSNESPPTKLRYLNYSIPLLFCQVPLTNFYHINPPASFPCHNAHYNLAESGGGEKQRKDTRSRTVAYKQHITLQKTRSRPATFSTPYCVELTISLNESSNALFILSSFFTASLEFIRFGVVSSMGNNSWKVSILRASARLSKVLSLTHVL